jgi:NADPH:quinone reductase-like Zn-dependent oxidoreductase
VVVIGSMGGRGSVEIDVGSLLSRRQQIIGSTLRGRSTSDKAAIVRAFVNRFGEDLDAGRIRPVIDGVFALDQAAEAHRRMEQDHFGKIVLRVNTS